MSQKNIELAQTVLAAWGDGSLADLDLLDPAAVWINPPEAVEGGVRIGAEEYISAGEDVRSAFEGARIEIDRWVETGDRVGAVGTLRGRGRGSGVDIERSIALIWTIIEGRVIRFEWFLGSGEVLEAAGLPE